MPRILPDELRSREVGHQEKAGLRSDHIGLPMAQVIADAIVSFYGSVKAAAISLGNVDPSLMQREFADGKFGRFDRHATLEAKAFIAKAQVDAYGDLSDPKARALQLQREIEARAAELVSIIVGSAA